METVQYISSCTSKAQQLYTSSILLAISFVCYFFIHFLFIALCISWFLRFIERRIRLFQLMRSKSPLMVGLDIQSDEMKLLQLRHAKTGYIVENYGVVPLPAGVIVDGKIKRFDQVQAALIALVQRTHSDGCATVIALPASNVIIQPIKLAAYLTEQECEVEITSHISRYLPGVTESVGIDFVKLPGSDRDFQSILLVAARQEQLQTYITLVEQAGLRPQVVDVDSYALLRGAKLCRMAENAEPFALIDVGVSLTQLLVAHQQQIIFMQHWLTQDDMAWGVHIHRALQLYATTFPHLHIKTFLLSGHIDKHAVLFQEAVNFPIEIVNPFARLPFAVAATQNNVVFNGSQWLLALGLAARGSAAC